MKSSGFTLIEISAVLVLMGLLAAAAVLSLAHTAGEHRFEGVCQDMEHLDGLVRSAARQSGKAQHLVVDLDQNQVLWQTDQDQTASTRMIVSAGHAELRVRTVSQTSSGGQVDIVVSPAAFSPSYALCLSQDGRPGRWMVVAGLTGRIFWTDDDRQVDAIFQSLQRHSLAGAAGNDAD